MRRRTFLVGGTGIAGALILGWGFLPPRSRIGPPGLLPALEGEVGLNGWLKIAADGAAILAMPRSEMGQGVHTALPMLVAEELDLPLARVRFEQAPFDRIYSNVAGVVSLLPLHPRTGEGAIADAARWMTAKVGRELSLQLTGGSSSIADAWPVVRQAAALVRASLVNAAARAWNTSASECHTRDGSVQHASGKSAHYGILARAAAQVPATRAEPKSPRDWTLIGTPAPRTDIPAKIDGSARFGIDVRLPKMLYAAIRMCPELGGSLASLDAAAAKRQPRIHSVVAVPAAAGSTAGFAVLAESWWHAERAADKVNARWAPGPIARLNTGDALQTLRTAAAGEDGFPFYRRGSIDDAFSAAAHRLEAEYDAPYLAHAAMEPINCTARVTADAVEVWVPTQVPDFARDAAAKAAGLSPDRVKLHVQLLGGGFGRRLETDVVAQAVHLAKQVPGRPVQLLWSREQDTTHDFYRPAHAARLAGAVDAKGIITGMRIQVAGDRIYPQWGARVYPLMSFDVPDRTAAEALFDLPYDIAHQRITHAKTDIGLPIGNWRSVGHSHNAFFAESFIDELAHRIGQDPVAFRLENLRRDSRQAAVLRFAATRAGWSNPLPTGRARGVALVQSYGTVVAQIAEVSLDPLGKPRVHRVTCALDCGVAVNPNIISQQMEGGIVFGLTAALHGRIDVRDGRVQQSNFSDLPLLGLRDAPTVDTIIMRSLAAPSGIGEPGVPPIAPAVANALFVLTGKRLRSLPLRL